MKQAISYIRFSSTQQVKGSSTARQKELVGAWLAKNSDYELSHLSASDLGVSGFTGRHLDCGLGGILKAIEQGKIQAGTCLLIEAVDRLGRLKVLEMVHLFRGIVQAGITVCTLEDNRNYSKESLNTNESELFILVGKIQQAHEYSKALGRRVAAAYEQKREKARAGAGVGSVKKRNVFWLDSDGKLKPKESDMVKACISQYLNNKGTRAICLEMSKTYPEFKDIHPRTIKRWLSNSALIGTWENSGEPIEGVFDALIDLGTYYSIQRQLQHKKRFMSPEQKYSLSGLVTCKCCSKHYYFRRKPHKGEVIIYANCSEYLKRGKCLNNATMPYEVLEYCFGATCIDALISIADQSIYAKEEEKVLILKGQISDLDKRISNILDILEISPNPIAKSRYTSLIKEKEIHQSKVNTLTGSLSGTASPIGEEFLEGYTHKPSPSSLMVLEISKDEIKQREALKTVGYSLFVNNRTITSNYSQRSDERFELIRRSQQFSCYIVKHSCHDNDDRWLAINRIKGLVASSESEDSLIQTLLSGAGSIA